MKTFIELKSVQFYAYHGAFPQELAVGNVFFVDLKVGVDIVDASMSDDLENTLSYADIYNILKIVMQKPSKLLENLAYRIVKTLRETYPQIQEIELKVYKRNPPIEGAEMEAAGIIIKD